MHIVRLLMNFSVIGHQSVKDCKELSVCQTVICVFFFRKRTGKIEIYPIKDSVGKIFWQIFRRAFDKTQVRNTLLNRSFGGNNNNVGAFLDRNIIDIGVALSYFGGELTLAAADLKANRIGVAKPFFKVYIFLFFNCRVKVFILALDRKKSDRRSSSVFCQDSFFFAFSYSSLR